MWRCTRWWPLWAGHHQYWMGINLWTQHWSGPGIGYWKKNSYQDGPRLIFTWYEAGINLVYKASITSGHPAVVGSLIPVLVTILIPGTGPIDCYNTSHLHGHCKLCSCSTESWDYIILNWTRSQWIMLQELPRVLEYRIHTKCKAPTMW
jgi:hypothetical protein